MGLRYRKTINLGGGARINISKSGIGYSWGGKGFRFTKTANGRSRATVRLPGTGLFYVTESSGKKKTPKRKPAKTSRGNTAGDAEMTVSGFLGFVVIVICAYIGIRVWARHGFAAMLGAVLLSFFAFVILWAVVASLAQSKGNNESAQKLQVQGHLQSLVNQEDGCQRACNTARDPETITPSRNGLYPEEILMLSYAPTYKLSGNQFPEFWASEYSVTDPQGLLQSLLDRGFLAVGDLQATLSHLKVTELKAELKSIGAPTSGKKAELIERLLSRGDIGALADKYPCEYYVLTEKGTQELKENEYVPYLHKTGYMSVFDMNFLLYHDNPSNFGYRDFLWKEFNKQSMAHFDDGDYGLYRNSRMDMYRFAMEEKRYSQAFLMLCEVAVYDINDLGNGEKMVGPGWEKLALEQALKVLFPYSDNSWHLPPAVVGWLADMKDILNLSNADFRAALLENFEKFYLPRRVFTNEECAEIVMNEIDDQPEKQIPIYHRAEQRVRAKLAEME